MAVSGSRVGEDGRLHDGHHRSDCRKVAVGPRAHLLSSTRAEADARGTSGSWYVISRQVPTVRLTFTRARSGITSRRSARPRVTSWHGEGPGCWMNHASFQDERASNAEKVAVELTELRRLTTVHRVSGGLPDPEVASLRARVEQLTEALRNRTRTSSGAGKARVSEGKDGNSRTTLLPSASVPGVVQLTGRERARRGRRLMRRPGNRRPSPRWTTTGKASTQTFPCVEVRDEARDAADYAGPWLTRGGPTMRVVVADGAKAARRRWRAGDGIPLCARPVGRAVRRRPRASANRRDGELATAEARDETEGTSTLQGRPGYQRRSTRMILGQFHVTTDPAAFRGPANESARSLRRSAGASPDGGGGPATRLRRSGRVRDLPERPTATRALSGRSTIVPRPGLWGDSESAPACETARKRLRLRLPENLVPARLPPRARRAEQSSATAKERFRCMQRGTPSSQRSCFSQSARRP